MLFSLTDYLVAAYDAICMPLQNTAFLQKGIIVPTEIDFDYQRATAPFQGLLIELESGEIAVVKIGAETATAGDSTTFAERISKYC